MVSTSRTGKVRVKILTVVGARPQFIKAVPLSRLARSSDAIDEVLVHTGQHYDKNLSGVFFDELGLSEPKYNLEIGSGSHAVQTGRMLMAMEEVVSREMPDIALLYGDTNSTLAGALAASKLHIPVAYVEAGLRSHNRKMPEEINRILTDHVSYWLFCPTDRAVHNLANEGISERVYNVGDVMYDCHMIFSELAAAKSTILADLELLGTEGPGGYYLATVHRPENTDSPERLSNIVSALEDLDMPVIFPMHPRTRAKMGGSANFRRIRVTEPVRYLDMVQLQRYARAVLTDSGGVRRRRCSTGCRALRCAMRPSGLKALNADGTLS